jgi:hypothetical protein
MNAIDGVGVAVFEGPEQGLRLLAQVLEVKAEDVSTTQ